MEKVLNIVDSQCLRVCEKHFWFVKIKFGHVCIDYKSFLCFPYCLFILKFIRLVEERILNIKYVLHFTVQRSFKTFCPYKYFVSHVKGIHKNTCL